MEFLFSPSGLELSFFSGVYSPSIGFTQSIGESAKQLVGLSGIFIGIGEVSGGVAFGLLGARTANKIGRDPIVILGFIIHVIAFFLIFLNLPNYANLGDTTEIGKNSSTLNGILNRNFNPLLSSHSLFESTASIGRPFMFFFAWPRRLMLQYANLFDARRSVPEKVN